MTLFCMRERITETAAMPPAMAYDDHSWPERDTFIGVAAFDCLCVPVSDLHASTVGAGVARF